MKQQKKLLHMLISKITINKIREIESIELNMNENLVMYLDNGGSYPSSFISRRKLKINPVNIKVCI